MRLSRYGIVLEMLRQDHLEMVRLWRNQDHVRKNMQFQKELSRDDQQHWFDNLDSERNLYWIIRSSDYPIGLIHIKEMDADLSTGEAGIFIGEPSYLYMPQPMLAILVMMELAFKALDMRQLRAKIRSGNKHAISFNEQLGYALEPDQPDGFQYYSVDEKAFEASTKKLRASAQHMYGSGTEVNQLTSLNELGSRLVRGLAASDEYFHPKFI